MPDALPALFSDLSDEQLWKMAGEDREVLIQKVRGRLARQLASRGYLPEIVAEAANVLDPNVLTLGFARRPVGYSYPYRLSTREPTDGGLRCADYSTPFRRSCSGRNPAHSMAEMNRDSPVSWTHLRGYNDTKGRSSCSTARID